MTRIRAGVALAALLLSSDAFPGGDCRSLEACFKRMRDMVDSIGDGSIHQDAISITEKLAQLPGAVPRLIPLLADQDPRLANLAAHALSSAEYIDPRYFPQIIAGLDRKLDWLPPALCAMPGDAPAREAVKRFLVSEEAPHNQEAVSVERCGRRALPFIVEAAKCTEGCADRLFLNLAHVLHEMDPKESASVGPQLLEIARTPRASDDTIFGALTMMGALGKPAAYLQPDLLDLQTKRPDLTPWIEITLVELRANNAGRIMARRLEEGGPGFSARLLLRDTAELRADGRDAGEAVMRYLASEDWDSRLAAARALGFIDYQPAVPKLIEAVNDPSDVRLNWVAVDSLGRLRNKAAIDVLQRAERDHWYAPVRRAATEALRHVRDGTLYESRFHPGNFPFEFFAYEHIGKPEDACARIPLPPLAAAQSRQLRASSDGVSRLKYPLQLPPRGPDEPPKIEMHSPDIALRVGGGWITGADRGEWGGELAFVGDDGAASVLLDENVHDIIRLGGRVIALTGLAHLTMNEGMIHELRQDPGGAWSAHPWRALPGQPGKAQLLKTGELAVEVYSGGTLLVAADGAMRMACGAKAK